MPWYRDLCEGAKVIDAFNSQPKTIGELLGNEAKLLVPTFQRPYSWEKRHVEAFWNDIIKHNEKEPTTKYFLGPIVLLFKANTIEILDGQQRLATATILFSALRDASRDLKILDAQNFARDIQVQLILREDPETEDSFSLEMGVMDFLYFKEVVQTQSEPPVVKKAAVRSHRNIRKAQQFLCDAVKSQIAGLDPAESLAKLKKLVKLFRNLVMACIPVNSEEQAFQIFETLNDRGLRLSVPDLLLNYLMKMASPTERPQIRQYWNDMLTKMGRRDINRFLRHLWVSKYGDLKSEDLFSALKKNIEQTKVNSIQFTRDCSEECNNYVQLIEIRDEGDLKEAAPYLRNLIRELDMQAALPLLLSAYTRLKAKDLLKLIQLILVFVTRYSVIVSLDPSGLETVLFSLARDVRSRLSDGSSVQACMKHVKQTLIKGAPADDQLLVAASDLDVAEDHATYLIGQIAAFMESSTKEVKPHEVNVEHIFPKSPGAEWPDAEELEPYLWHLGNLTNLGKRLNTGVANRGYAFKRKIYEQNSELKMAQRVAKEYSKWNAAAIKDRAQKLAPMVTKIWNFDNPSHL